MELYHSSGELVEFPEIRGAKYTKDFSWGFYCTNNLEQAKKWGIRRSDHPIINVYNYEENNKLKILKFDKMNNDWLDFVVQSRKRKYTFV